MEVWRCGCNLVRNEITSSSSSSVLNTSSASYWLQCRWRVYIWLLIGQLGYDVIILTDPGRLQLLVTRPPRLPGLTPALDPGREPRYITTREYKHYPWTEISVTLLQAQTPLAIITGQLLQQQHSREHSEQRTVRQWIRTDSELYHFSSQ